MRTQTWINAIGMICVIVGAIGIYQSSIGITSMTFEAYQLRFSPEVPLYVPKLRYALRYLSLGVNIIYFTAGIYFLWKRSFSLNLMKIALLLSLLKFILPMLFLAPSTNIQKITPSALYLLNFVRPLIDWVLLLSVVLISKKFDSTLQDSDTKTYTKSESKPRFRITTAFILGLAIEFVFPWLLQNSNLECLGNTLIAGGVYLGAGAALGYYWPAYSWKNGLWLVAPLFLLMLPLGMFSNWFAAGWEFALGALMNCSIYSLGAALVMGCLGSFLGSFLYRRKVL